MTTPPRSLRTKPSAALGVLLAISLLSMLTLVALCVSQPHWGLIGLIVVLGLWSGHLARTWVRAYRSGRMQPPSADAATAGSQTEAPAAVPFEPGALFTSKATQFVGMRYREGYVVFGTDVAGFVPTDKWRHLAQEILLGLVTTQLSLTRLELDIHDSPALHEELSRLVEQQGGFFLDAQWSFTFGGAVSLRGAVMRRGEATLVVVDTPPAEAMRPWCETALPEDTQGLTTIRKVVLVLASIALLLVAAGMLGWRLSGNADYLVAGLVWGGLIGGSTLVGYVLGKRLACARKKS